jgi:hypothetical protein
MPKESDYCSLSPDYILGNYIGSACKSHDLAYSQPNLTRQRRLEADIALKNDIKALLPFYLKFVAYIYFVAVRLFGWIYEEEIREKGKKIKKLLKRR